MDIAVSALLIQAECSSREVLNGEEYQETEQWEGAGHVNPRLKEKYALRGIPGTSAERSKLPLDEFRRCPPVMYEDDTELSADARGMPPSRSSYLSLNL